MKVKLTKKMEDIVEFLDDFPAKIYFVGGCVRDLVMGIEPHDYDMCTSVEPNEIQKWVKSKGKKPWLQGKRFGTIGFKQEGDIIEITTYRKEIYNFVSRKPVVSYSKKLQEDLGRRDFTINALVCDLKGNVKDYVGGLKDIENKLLCCVGNPKIRFKEDPLRILRAIRQSNKYELHIEAKTLEKLNHCRWEILRLSKERITEEIEKTFKLPSRELAYAISMYFEQDLFQIIFPELHLQKNFNQESPYHDFLLNAHTIKVVESVREKYDDSDKLWSALFHDIGKPFTKIKSKNHKYFNYINHDVLGVAIVERLLRDYKFSNKSREFIVESIKDHIKDDSWLKQHDDVSKRL